jgi:hypothetical protein
VDNGDVQWLMAPSVAGCVQVETENSDTLSLERDSYETDGTDQVNGVETWKILLTVLTCGP